MRIELGDIVKLSEEAPDGVKQMCGDRLMLITALAYEADTGERKIIAYEGETQSSFILRERDIEVVSDIESEMAGFAKILSSGNQA